MRNVTIADHIWDAFEEMASSMGTDRDGLINQAMFMFARLNGFLDAGSTGAARSPNGARAAPMRSNSIPVLAPVKTRDEAPALPGPRLSQPSMPKLEDDPVRREVAEHVLETAAELERLIKGKANPPPPEPSLDGPLPDEVGDDDPPSEPSEEPSRKGGALYLMAEGGEPDKISKDRFVIGRGKHCDFVINSGKVSREHAVIIREGSDFFIEDLGSSNGTWFNKQRIKRRKIEDGDEYYICSEKIKLVVR